MEAILAGERDPEQLAALGMLHTHQGIAAKRLPKA